jgi:hypothetical protein
MNQKKLFINEREKSNLIFRKNVLSQLDYLQRIAKSDFEFYITTQVYQRLGIKPGTNVKLNDELEYLEIIEEEKNEPVANTTK